MRKPDARDAARVLALALVAMAAAMLLAQLGLPNVVSLFVMQGGFLGLPLLYARKAGLRPFVDSGYVRLSHRQIALVLIASMGSFWLLYGLTKVQAEIFRVIGQEKVAQEEEQQLNRSIEALKEQGALPAVSLLVVVPAICEETFFRGILFRGLLPRFGLAISLGSTSLLFAAVHGTWAQKGIMIFLGCYFGVLVVLTGSLWASVLAHAVNNLAVVTMNWIYGTGVSDFNAPWWLYVSSAVVFALAITSLALERNRGVD
jgi:membrane protease YdiL (CAAX protease family)